MRGPLAAAVLILLVARASLAQPIVIEAHVLEQSPEAVHVLPPIHDELARLGYRVGYDAVGAYLERNVSHPGRIRFLDAKSVEAQLTEGVEQRITGDFKKAVETLNFVFADVRANPYLLASDQSLRKSVFRAQIALAISEQRIGDQLAAAQTMADVIRSFPDIPITHGSHGPEVDKLHQRVRRRLDAGGRGAITVTVNDPEVSVFINDRLVGSGKAARADLYPGTYRVYVQRGSTPGRMRTVQVSRGVVAELRIDWEFDSILHTSSKWTGGRFRTHGDRANRIAYVAKRIASELDAPLVVVFEFGQFRGQPVVTGTVYDGATGAMVRSGNVALAPDPSVTALGAFGRFLDSGAMEAELAAVIADGDHDDNQPQPREGGRRGLPRWVPWTGVAVGTAAVVGGGVLHWLDGRCRNDAFQDGPEACFTTYDTALEGWLAVGAGVVLVGSAVTYRLVWDQPEPARHQIGVAPTISGALFVVVGSF